MEINWPLILILTGIMFLGMVLPYALGRLRLSTGQIWLVIALIGLLLLVIGISLSQNAEGLIDSSGNIIPDQAPYPECIKHSDGILAVVKVSCTGSYEDITWLLEKGYSIDAVHSTCTDCIYDYGIVWMTR